MRHSSKSGAWVASVAVLATTFAGSPLVHAQTAQVSSERAVPDVPWGFLAAGVDTVDLMLSPLTGMSDPVLEASESFAPLATVGHILGLTGAVLPVVADSLWIVERLSDTDLEVRSISVDPQSAAWQLPQLPSLDPLVSNLASALPALTDEMASAAECACLPFGIGNELVKALPMATEASELLTTYSPVLDSYDALVGYSEPRTYLTVIGNQAEMRASGGAPLYAAVVTADDGLVTLDDKGATSTHFFPPMNRPVTWTGVEGNAYFPDNPRTQPFVNAGTNPDFAISGAEFASAFSAGGHAPVDGVLFVDLTFLQGLLDLTGPVTVEGVGEVTSGTLAVQLLDNAYAETESLADNARRQAANDRIVDALLGRLEAGLPALAGLEEVSEAAAGRHLQVWFHDGAIQETFDELGWTGRLEEPADTDWLAWYTQSGNPSKTDVRQGRTVAREVVVNGTRASVATEYVVINNNEPLNDPTIDERRGYRATWMKTAVMIYVPSGATNIRVLGLKDMKPSPLTGVPVAGEVMTDDFGHRFLRFSGWIAPFDQATIEISYDLELASPDTYSVTLEPQAALTPYQATFSVDGSGESTEFGPVPVTERATISAS